MGRIGRWGIALRRLCYPACGRIFLLYLIISACPIFDVANRLCLHFPRRKRLNNGFLTIGYWRGRWRDGWRWLRIFITAALIRHFRAGIILGQNWCRNDERTKRGSG